MDTVSRHPSGFALITHERPDAETVALGVFINAGTRDETEAEHGAAHCLEHMAFKGTRTRSAYQIVAEIEGLGGDINAETSHETTSYTARMLAEDWRAGLDVLLDIVTAPRFAPDDLELERGVICQEIAGSLDDPDDRVTDGVGLAAFEGQAVGRPILGTTQSVGAISVDSLDAFRARTGVASQVVLSVAGPISHAALADHVDRLAPAFPGSQAVPRPRPHFAPGRFADVRDTHDTHLALAWEGPGYSDPQAVPNALALQVLGGGMTSRLFQSIREEHGLAYAIDAYPLTFLDGGLGVLQTATAPEQVSHMKRQVLEQMRRLADGITESELAAAKRQFRASLAMGAESLSAIAARNARQLTAMGRLRGREEIQSLIDAASLADVRDTWQRVMDASQFALAGVGSQQALDVWFD
ncbi:MAG: insulinase family protein [Devosiaceae bacterium]|nr:insulinase family protein [Devosiaceae bacterium MH13]